MKKTEGRNRTTAQERGEKRKEKQKKRDIKSGNSSISEYSPPPLSKYLLDFFLPPPLHLPPLLYILTHGVSL